MCMFVRALVCLACAGHAAATEATAKAFMPARSFPQPSNPMAGNQLAGKVAQMEFENEAMKVEIERLGAQMEDTQESSFGGFAGAAAVLGLAASLGFAATRKYFSHAEQQSEPGLSAQLVDMPQRVAPIVMKESTSPLDHLPEMAAGALAAAAIATTAPLAANAVSGQMDFLTGNPKTDMAMNEKKFATQENFNETYQRRLGEDFSNNVPGLVIAGISGILFAQWASYQEDDVDFFDEYDSRRVDRAGNATGFVQDEARQARFGAKPVATGAIGGLSAAQLAQKREAEDKKAKAAALAAASLEKAKKAQAASAKPKASAPSFNFFGKKSPKKVVKRAGITKPMPRRELVSKMFGASALFTAAAANAKIDYKGVAYLGGSAKIDVNNANIRVYQKLPQMYPTVAGKIVKNAPFKDKSDMVAKCKFSSSEMTVLDKYAMNFLYLEPQPEYIIDNINNGLYR